MDSVCLRIGGKALLNQRRSEWEIFEMEGPGAIPALGCIPERRRCCSKTAPLNGSGMGGRVGGKKRFSSGKCALFS